MRKTSIEYIEYLKINKNISNNTVLSYSGDLDKMIEYFNMHRIFDYERINETNLNSYILALELKGNSNATITRNIAVMKGYFDYLFKTHRISNCITEQVKRPPVESRRIIKTTPFQVRKILEEAQGEDPKSLRDHAMLQLFCTVGIQVTELIDLQVQDVNLAVGYVVSRMRNKNKTYQISSDVCEVLRAYIVEGRPKLMKNSESTIFFPNMQGGAMSRQGVWKMVKTCAAKAGIDEVSPAKLCRSI